MTHRTPHSRRGQFLIASIILMAILGHIGTAQADLSFIDLTHPIPTFAPHPDDPTKPDLTNPVGGSVPISGFYHQAILYPPQLWPTNEGLFDSRAVLVQEHNGTSFNAPNHYLNDETSLAAGGIPSHRRQAAHQLKAGQLTGQIVLIDVSARVQAELDKNGGRPSADIAVTDFSDISQATIRAADIDTVADQIDDGVWIVGHLGWSQFFAGAGEDWDASPYVNALNHPGFTREAVRRLIGIMEQKGVTISGIAADSLSTDSGAGAKGTDNTWSNAWPAHVQLYQRGILIVENLTGLETLAQTHRPTRPCTLIVGALKHVGGTGGPARVFAACN